MWYLGGVSNCCGESCYWREGVVYGCGRLEHRKIGRNYWGEIECWRKVGGYRKKIEYCGTKIGYWRGKLDVEKRSMLLRKYEEGD